MAFFSIDLSLYCKQPYHLAKVYGWSCGDERGVDRWIDAMSKARVIITRKKFETCEDGRIVTLFCHYTKDRIFFFFFF